MKLMGRQSGFIATYASIASGEVDVCLIPEVPFVMDGARTDRRTEPPALRARAVCTTAAAARGQRPCGSAAPAHALAAHWGGRRLLTAPPACVKASASTNSLTLAAARSPQALTACSLTLSTFSRRRATPWCASPRAPGRSTSPRCVFRGYFAAVLSL